MDTDIEVEWHEVKRATNLKKHGIDFLDAATIWCSPVANRRSVYVQEDRFVSVGRMGNRIIAVVWTLRGTRRRLISARMARNNERQCYAAFLEGSGQRPH
ncbi:MAG TPA: BrnT family toxin [Acetobacteraceae bacterium]|jgi:hypothetical protein